MKTTIKTMVAVCMMAVSLSSFAFAESVPNNLTSNEVVAAYLNSSVLGKIKSNELLFAKDFQFVNGQSGTSYTRKQYTDFLKKNENVQYDCNTTYKLLDESGDVAMAKITMAFENFTRVDFITLKKVDNDWKISKVEATYPSK